MLRSRVIIPTASAESGTGDPIPMSCPVSRGRSLERDSPDAPTAPSFASKSASSGSGSLSDGWLEGAASLSSEDNGRGL